MGKAGNLNVTASDFVQLSGNNTDQNGNLIPGGLFTNTVSDSPAGNLNIKTRRLTVTNGAQIAANTLGAGKGGNIEINSDSLIVRDGGKIITEALGTTGQAGDLKIVASDLVQLSGSFTDSEGNILFTSLSSSAFAENASAGNLSIETDTLTITDGAQIRAATIGDGNGGNISIKANSIEIFGATVNSSSGIFAVSGGISTENNEIIVGSGDGGTITITTDSLNIQSGAGIGTFTIGTGKAGKIFILVNDSLKANNGGITSSSLQSAGGEINITAGNIRLKGNSDIFTNVEEGAGGGGNITLTADSVVAFDDSDIFTFSSDGVGGDITINTPVFLAENFTPNSLTSNPNNLDSNNRVDINATGAISGFVAIPDVSFIQNSLIELPDNALNTDKLVANSCVVPSREQNGTFIITGKDGFALHPSNWTVSHYSTGDVRAIPENINNNWQPGDSIIEPQGLYRLTNGKLVLSRECSQAQ